MTERTAALLDWTMHRIGHEIRNDLNALQTSNHLLLHAQLDADDREVLMQNAATIREIGVLVDLAVRASDLRRGTLPLRRADPVAVLQEVTASMRRTTAVQCLAEARGDATVSIDRGLLEWALGCLIRSGFQPMPDAQSLCLDLERRGSDIALIVAGAELRPLPAGEPWHDAGPRSIAVHRADLELLLVREAAVALGGALRVEADRQPPAWAIVLPAA